MEEQANAKIVTGFGIACCQVVPKPRAWTRDFGVRWLIRIAWSGNLCYSITTPYLKSISRPLKVRHSAVTINLRATEGISYPRRLVIQSKAIAKSRTALDMASLSRRDIDWGDDFDDDHDDRYYSYWGYDRTAFIVKWVLIAVLLFLIVLWLVGGYFHAQRRMKKGLPPMLYHRVRVSGTPGSPCSFRHITASPSFAPSSIPNSDFLWIIHVLQSSLTH